MPRERLTAQAIHDAELPHVLNPFRVSERRTALEGLQRAAGVYDEYTLTRGELIRRVEDREAQERRDANSWGHQVVVISEMLHQDQPYFEEGIR